MYYKIVSCIAAMALAYVPIISLGGGCFLLVGEPKLPEKLLQQKESKMD